LDGIFECLELVQACRKPRVAVSQLPDQNRSRVIVYQLTCVSTAFTESRNRARYDWIEILCHHSEDPQVGAV
jgi:hypothetical protein